jgi:putative transposase
LKDEYHLKVSDLVLHINKSDNLSITKQAELLGISRSNFYYHPAPVDPVNPAVMNKIDEIYTQRPYYGSRKIAKQITRDWGYPINRKRIQKLMREMGLEAIYPKPNLSKNANQHPVFPYLLRNVPIIRSDQVWGTDITYIRMEKGFLYLAAFMDWYSRFVLAWRLSNTLTTNFVIEAAKEALNLGIPEITNSDQGVQFTSNDYISVWDQEKTKISMDGRGRAMDNIFTERLWRSVKYDEVYIKNYTSVSEAVNGIGDYLKDYNYGRLHESLGYKTPAEVYFNKKKGGENIVLV